MDVFCAPAEGVVDKQARTAEERRRLHHEAAVLQAIPHPGVVQLIGPAESDAPGCLRLRRVPGGDLAALGPRTLDEVAGLGAALATTLADLHDLAVSHGAIEATHVLLDEDGRPVLCSFGRAERDLRGPPAEARQRDDVRALARLLLDLLPAGGPKRMVRTLRLAAGPGAGSGRQRRSPNPRWLARQLVSHVPSARLPDLTRAIGHSEPEAGRADASPTQASRWAGAPQRRPLRPLVIAAASAVLGLVACAATLVVQTSASSSSVDRRPVACPIADDGCGPVATSNGYLATTTGRYQVVGNGDVVVLGRWRCGPSALPAVLRPVTGEVWTFAAWPRAGRSEVARRIAQVGSAWSLRVVPQRSGCDQLEVERRGQATVTIAVAPP